MSIGLSWMALQPPADQGQSVLLLTVSAGGGVAERLRAVFLSTCFETERMARQVLSQTVSLFHSHTVFLRERAAF